MLSDEEKEAIEYWKTHMEILHWNTQLASEHYIKVLLDLVEKQQKEIEELNFKNEKLYEDNLTLAQEIKEFIEGTNDVKYYSTSFIKNHYISKDKIKAKILECRKILYSFEKELELKANKEKYIHKESMNCLLSQISILQSLLEKE